MNRPRSFLRCLGPAQILSMRWTTLATLPWKTWVPSWSNAYMSRDKREFVDVEELLNGSGLYQFLPTHGVTNGLKSYT
jgi:hypothetical protein